MKNYIAKHSSRTIPVGYSAADVRQVLQDTWAYLQCSIASQSTNGNTNANTTDASRSDFFGLNSYSWCGPSTVFADSGYPDLLTYFASTTIPVFFSEYGCIQPAPRVFNEVQALYGPNMSLLSGGLVYEWTEDGNGYGLTTVAANGSLNLGPDYVSLQVQYDKLNASLLTSGNVSAEAQAPPQCGPQLISADGFTTNFAIPPPPLGAEQLISSGVASPPTGKIVPVTQSTVQLSCSATDGAALQNLVLRQSDGSNEPGGQHALAAAGASSSASSSSKGGGMPSATDMAPAASATKKSGAAAVLSRIGAGGVLGAAVLACLVLSL